VYLKPERFPIWIPLTLGAPTESFRFELSPGPVQIATTKNSVGSTPGFVLDWGVLSERVSDGQIRLRNRPAMIECKGGQGRAVLSWYRNDNFGLEGEVTLADGPKKTMVTPG